MLLDSRSRSWPLLLAAEIAVFAAIGTNFLTAGNAFEVARASVEIGLLALALTPVIISGGIDLSVGSLMGLSAVLFGAPGATAGCRSALAALVALAVGAAGGALERAPDHAPRRARR